MKIVKCKQPKGREYPKQLCPECGRFMRGYQNGEWYCSMCGEWWVDADDATNKEKE